MPFRSSPALTFPLSLFSFLSAATYVLTRAIGVGLFLARVGVDYLPATLAVSAAMVLVASYATRTLFQRHNGWQCAAVTWFLLTLSSLAIAVSIGTYHHSIWLLGAIYVLAEIRGCVNTVYITSFANDAFSQFESKRPFVLVATGAPVAGLIFGALLSIEVSSLKDTSWIEVIAGLDILTLLTINWLSKSDKLKDQPADQDHLAESETRRSQSTRETGDRQSQSLPSLSAAAYRRKLAYLVGFKIAALTLIGYQWKVSVSEYFLINESQTVAFFAAFYATSDVAIILLQVFAASWLIDRIGIGGLLRIYPVLLFMFGAVAVGAFVVPEQAFGISKVAFLMGLFTCVRGLNVMRRSLHDPALASAYSILDNSVRSETIVFVTGMIKPFSEAAVAIVLVILAGQINRGGLTCLWMLFILPWLFFATQVSEVHQELNDTGA